VGDKDDRARGEMAKVLVVGGGFGGVVAAESLAKKLGRAHEITLVSRSRKFLFYPALVRLAFGQCEPDDIAFDVREAMVDRRVRFIEGEIAQINPHERRVTFVLGDVVEEMPYDFLVLALGRRLAKEQIAGLFEHSHHLLGMNAAQKFGKAVRDFHYGRAVIGYCPGARLPVPVFETAFGLSRHLKESGERNRCAITIVSAETPDEMFGGVPILEALDGALKWHDIELVSDFAIARVTPYSVIANDVGTLDCDLRMLIPPFVGPSAVRGMGITDEEGYVRVDTTMRVLGVERMYAAGDCVSFKGPKMGHMAVRQGEVAAENLAAEIQGCALSAVYDHQMMLVIDAAGRDSIFVRKDLWSDDPADIKQGKFWAWAKRMERRYWKAKHA
jgi:sulfide:quinone oxidoreductase